MFVIELHVVEGLFIFGEVLVLKMFFMQVYGMKPTIQYGQNKLVQ